MIIVMKNSKINRQHSIALTMMSESHAIPRRNKVNIHALEPQQNGASDHATSLLKKTQKLVIKKAMTFIYRRRSCGVLRGRWKRLPVLSRWSPFPLRRPLVFPCPS
jgi:hypothetical protein